MRATIGNSLEMRYEVGSGMWVWFRVPCRGSEGDALNQRDGIVIL